MTKSKAFTIEFPQSQIDDILARVRAYRWGDMPQIAKGGDRWAYGTDMAYMKELCAYWCDGYDWRKAEDLLNRFTHYKAQIDGLGVHYILAPSENRNAPWLLMTHGWPGSVLEFLDVIDPLANPQNSGGALEDGVHVVCPSLPGYGFSDKPKAPIGPLATAGLWDKLMRDVIGANQYIAQGGDWGAVITGCLGLHHAPAKGGGCQAIHLNMLGLRAQTIMPQGEEETQWVGMAIKKMEAEGAYLRLHTTKPQTLSYAMQDNPVGVCAWIIEKFHGWSDLRGPSGNDKHIENAYSKDKLLDNIMLYLLTNSFGTSTWFYRGYFEEGPPNIPDGQKVEVPTGIGAFPDAFLDFPPHSMVERSYNVVHWQDYDRFGHFAALEAGEVFVKEIQTFLAKLR